jgi:hypothetical protein
MPAYYTRVRAAVIALLVTACGRASLIEATPTGGILELHGDRANAVKRANMKMLLHCGSADATIIKIGDENGDYRVHYRCNSI